MKRFTLLLGAAVLLVSAVGACTRPQYHMKAWDRNTHEKLGEWYVYRDGCRYLTVDNDAEVQFGQATVILEEAKPPQNRIVLRQRSEDNR